MSITCRYLLPNLWLGGSRRRGAVIASDRGTSPIRLSFANWPARCDQSTVEPLQRTLSALSNLSGNRTDDASRGPRAEADLNELLLQVAEDRRVKGDCGVF